MKRFNIALTFESSVNELIVDYAKVLYKTIDSDVLLEINSRPHLTIGQFMADDNTAMTLWNKFKKSCKVLPNITLSGFTILPSSKGGAWFEITVLKSNELQLLQNSLISILHPKIELINDVNDYYRPHITIAHSISGNQLDLLPLNYQAVRMKDISTSLEIGLGTNFEKL